MFAKAWIEACVHCVLRLHPGTVVQGMFSCRKCDNNSRELQVEIHYKVRESAEADASGDVIVQMFTVR